MPMSPANGDDRFDIGQINPPVVAPHSIVSKVVLLPPQSLNSHVSAQVNRVDLSRVNLSVMGLVLQYALSEY